MCTYVPETRNKEISIIFGIFLHTLKWDGRGVPVYFVGGSASFIIQMGRSTRLQIRRAVISHQFVISAVLGIFASLLSFVPDMRRLITNLPEVNLYIDIFFAFFHLIFFNGCYRDCEVREVTTHTKREGRAN